MAKILLTAILVLSFLLRFYRLDSIPASLNPDEKFNAYTAYSLLKTGKDERGNFFPVAVKTFGNWTLIGYPAIDMIPVAVLGLTELAARLPAAVFSVFGSLLMYAIAKRISRREIPALLSALFFTISPWGLFLSRISHESVIGLVMFLTGLWLFLKAKEENGSKWLLGSMLVFGLGLLTHYAYIIFVPLMVAFLLITNRKSFPGKLILIGAGLFTVFIVIVVSTILRGSIHEMNDVSIFNNRDILYGRVERFRGDGNHQGDILEKFHNRYFGVAYQLAQNYAAVFSPAFLFDKGGEALMHNLGYFGNFYLFDLVLIVAGGVFLAWRRDKNLFFLIFWVAVAPLTSVFTKDNPSSTRLLPLMPAMVMLSAFGLSELLLLVKKSRRLVYGLTLVSVLVILVDVVWFFDAYFAHLNVQRARFLNFGYKEAAQVANHYPRAHVVMVGPENFSYISFLFYNRFDPDTFRREVMYYPAWSTGFQLVRSFDRFEFVEGIDRSKMDSANLYIDYASPGDGSNLIRLPGGDPLFTYFPPKQT